MTELWSTGNLTTEPVATTTESTTAGQESVIWSNLIRVGRQLLSAPAQRAPSRPGFSATFNACPRPSSGARPRRFLAVRRMQHPQGRGPPSRPSDVRRSCEAQAGLGRNVSAGPMRL